MECIFGSFFPNVIGRSLRQSYNVRRPRIVHGLHHESQSYAFSQKSLDSLCSLISFSLFDIWDRNFRWSCFFKANPKLLKAQQKTRKCFLLNYTQSSRNPLVPIKLSIMDHYTMFDIFTFCLKQRSEWAFSQCDFGPRILKF